MSGWIKIEKNLESDPRVLRMAKELSKRSNAGALPYVTLVIGALARLWIYADSHAREDDTLDMGCRELDEWIGIDGFCALMPREWLVEIDEKTVELPGYQEHNGTEARKRALTQKRVEKHRERISVTSRNASSLPDQTKTKTNKDMSTSSTTPVNGNHHPKLTPPDVSRVFEHWKVEHNHPKAGLDDKRLKAITQALKSYTAEVLCQSITGYKNSPFHMGQNETQTRYDGLDLMLRNAENIDRGLKCAEEAPRLKKWV